MAPDDERRRAFLREFLSERQQTTDHYDAIRQGYQVPTLYELVNGAPFFRGEVHLDIAVFVGEELANRLLRPQPKRIRDRLVQLRDAALGGDADQARAAAAALQRAAARLRVQEDPLQFTSQATWLERIETRCDLYLCAYGDREAQLRCAGLAFERLGGLSPARPLYVDVLTTVIARLMRQSTRLRPDIFDVQGGLWGLDQMRLALQNAEDAASLAAEDAGRERRGPGRGIRAIGKRDHGAEMERTREEYADVLRDVAEDRPTPGTLGQTLGEVYIDDFSDDPSAAEPEQPTLIVVPSSSVEHLPKSGLGASARKGFEAISGKALPLITCDDPARVAAILRPEFPWAVDVIDVVLRKLVGQRFVRLGPLLFLGEPGCGKTRLARRIGEILGVPVTVYAAAGTADAAFGGTSRQWSTGRPAVPLQTVIRSRVANPMLVIDELEKAGTGTQNGRLADVLVPLLETESAERFFDPYLEGPVNLAAVSFLATANSLDGVSGPLLDRFQVVRVPEPEAEHLGEIARRIVAEIRIDRGGDPAWMPDLDPDELDLLAEHWKGGSLRPLRRMITTVLDGRDVLAARH